MVDHVTSFAPGRVEVLGNHTDYNQGLVLSAAIHLGVTVQAKLTNDRQLRFHSAAFGKDVSVPADRVQPVQDETWVNYPLGVVHFLRQEGLPATGVAFDIGSDLPVGAGLSSSAALEVATALALVRLFGLPLEGMRLAQLCQRAENDFVGVQCGLLDQASSVFGKPHQIIQLDFRSVTAVNVPIPDAAALLVVNSAVPHELTGGEYNERRAQCTEAAALLGVPFLRDATSADVERSTLPDVLRRRALHITGEDERVVQAVAALRGPDLAEVGRLMYASHLSSRDQFENSTHHLDTLVEIAMGLPGVYGARLSGGGFGGSIIALVQKEQAPAVLDAIGREYARRTGAQCQGVLTAPSDGARLVEGD